MVTDGQQQAVGGVTGPPPMSAAEIAAEVVSDGAVSITPGGTGATTSGRAPRSDQALKRAAPAALAAVTLLVVAWVLRRFTR